MLWIILALDWYVFNVPPCKINKHIIINKVVDRGFHIQIVILSIKVLSYRI